MSRGLPSREVDASGGRATAGGFLGSLVSVGMTIYLFGVFQDALVVAFDTSVSTLAFGPSLFTAASGILSPLVGRSLSTPSRPGLSIRTVMFAGAVSLGMGFVLLSRAPSIGWAALAFGGLIAPGAILMGPLLGQALVTQWFTEGSGRMLGVVSAGTTVGGMLMPPIAAVLIESLGWRSAMVALGVMAMGLMIPAIALLVRERPPGGSLEAGSLSGEEEALEVARTASTAEHLRDPRLWLVGIAFGLIFSAGMISTIFMVPFATEMGIPLVWGATVAGARSGLAATGKIVFGALGDRFGIRPVLGAVVAVEAALTALLIQTREPWVFVAIFVSIGFVGGAPLPLKASMARELFGRTNFAGSMGLLQSLAAPFQLAIVPIGGFVYASTGSYASVFLLTIPCFLLGGLLPVFLRAPERAPVAAR
ncbi:MAG: MFS transporter [bacterium]|nr:MFS transporter [bacterium]